MQFTWLIRAGLLVGGIVAARRVAAAIEVERRRIDAFVRTEVHSVASYLGVTEPVLRASSAVERVKLHGHWIFVNRSWAKTVNRHVVLTEIARELARKVALDADYVVGRVLARDGFPPKYLERASRLLSAGDDKAAASIERGYWAHKPYSLT